MNRPCPFCNVRHRNLPQACFYSVHADHVHVVIARVASLGTSEQQEWAKEATTRWTSMRDYVKSQWPNDELLSRFT
jgi:hypothetical protein